MSNRSSSSESANESRTSEDEQRQDREVSENETIAVILLAVQSGVKKFELEFAITLLSLIAETANPPLLPALNTRRDARKCIVENDELFDLLGECLQKGSFSEIRSLEILQPDDTERLHTPIQGRKVVAKVCSSTSVDVVVSLSRQIETLVTVDATSYEQTALMLAAIDGTLGKEEWIKKLAQCSREGLEKISDQVELLLFECGKGITMEMGMQYNMQFLARLGSRLHGTISDFVTLLKDSDKNIQSCRLSALAKLSEQGAVGEFPTATANAILDLVALLKDSDRYGRSSRVLALAKFSEQGAVGDNGIGIQLRFDDRRILNGHCGCHSRHCCLLEDSDEDVRSGGVLALGKFSEQGAVGDNWIGIQLTFDNS
ncbi:hypothetical protein BU17DRAFT_63521 [Hysterangium stoloniferum]|nr:hypothetical protein BU17DRAFT_63521 [Hysterangium stoloniferum]